MFLEEGHDPFEKYKLINQQFGSDSVITYIRLVNEFRDQSFSRGSEAHEDGM